jgi:Mg-chelatase subunit ChlD
MKKVLILSLMLFVVSFLLTVAEAQTFTRKSITGTVKANKYPEIELVVNVRDAKTGKGIYGLKEDDFSISENGFVQKIDRYNVKAAGKVDPIDIVFVFDQTGSMQDEINSVRDNCLNFADILKSSNMDYRLGLVTFSDRVEKNYGFVADVEDFKKRISVIRADGGGDEPENDLEALNAALKFDFRKDAKIVFILITDASYHQNDSVTRLTMLEVLKKIKLEGIRMYPITINIPQYVWMAKETDGQYFNIMSDFSSIIERLAVDLTAQYRISYITSHSSFDNTDRNIELKVKDFGTAKMQYRSAANITASSQLYEHNRPADAYKAENVLDGKSTTAWAEGVDGPGIGEWLKFGLDEPRKVKAVRIISGYPKTPQIFRNNNRVRTIKISFSDGKFQMNELKDVQESQRILIDRDAPTSYIKLEIMDVYKGAKFDDTCIAEVEFEYAD